MCPLTVSTSACSCCLSPAVSASPARSALSKKKLPSISRHQGAASPSSRCSPTTMATPTAVAPASIAPCEAVARSSSDSSQTGIQVAAAKASTGAALANSSQQMTPAMAPDPAIISAPSTRPKRSVITPITAPLR